MVMNVFLAKVLLLGAVVIAVAGAAFAVEVPRVPWELDQPWGVVLEKAQAEGKPILLDFHAPWCGPCKMLDSFVYNEKLVIEALASVLTVKFDVDVASNDHLKESFNISLLPTLIWCDAKGREVDRFTGFLNRDEFLAKIGEFRQAELDFSSISNKLQRHPEDAKFLLRMAELQARRGNLPEAEIHYRRLINLRLSAAMDEETNQYVTKGMLQFAAMQESAGQNSEAKNMGRLAARLDGSEVAVAAFQESIGDSEGMLETYRQMVARDDMDIEALAGFARASLEQRTELVEGTRMAIRAAVLSDEDPEMVALLSELFYRRGLYRKSIRWMKKAVEAEPENNSFRSQLQRYESALKNDPYGMKGVPD